MNCCANYAVYANNTESAQRALWAALARSLLLRTSIVVYYSTRSSTGNPPPPVPRTGLWGHRTISPMPMGDSYKSPSQS